MIYDFEGHTPKIDPGSWVASNAVIIGKVVLKKHSNIWFNTTLNKTKIGKNCIIGANALVTENKVIPERSLVLGSPGKVVRQVTDEEIEHIKENARDYVENFKKYKK